MIRIAEHSIGIRDMQTLAEVSEVLLNLPLPDARQAGAYYYALAMKRRGQPDHAQSLLETIANSPTAACRARAMQTLGVLHQEEGNLDDAGRFYVEAMRAGGEHDLISVLSAHVTLSTIKSANGDHTAALSDLEDIFPLFRFAATQYPFSFYLYHNALAVEFAELGRIAEAPALAKVFAEVFEKLGWTVAICTSRDCAMRQVAGSEPYDLILVSDHLPGTNGVELIRFIRSLEHRMMTAVVMVTGIGEIADEAKAAGADDVLVKPVNVSSLIWVVNKHVS